MKSALVGASIATVLLIGLFSWWFQSGWLLVTGYAVFGVLAMAAIPLCYRWFGYHDTDVLSALFQQEQREHDEMLARLNQLERDLSALENDEGAAQTRTLTSLLTDFHGVIANRFDGKQLSTSSYMGAARRVQNQALQNLSDMVGIGHSIVSLGRQNSREISEQAAQQQQRVNTLLDENRRLFKALSDTSVEVANIQEIGEFERTETLARLKDLGTIARQQGA